MKVLLAALHMSAHGTGQQSFGLSSTAAIGGAADITPPWFTAAVCQEETYAVQHIAATR